ncbi:hypothetical protein B5F33_02245 [Collinsella sp. An2]|nr:hypothetical protein B5F33_02245 [Collinsella sp. An2]
MEEGWRERLVEGRREKLEEASWRGWGRVGQMTARGLSRWLIGGQRLVVSACISSCSNEVLDLAVLGLKNVQIEDFKRRGEVSPGRIMSKGLVGAARSSGLDGPRLW